MNEEMVARYAPRLARGNYPNGNRHKVWDAKSDEWQEDNTKEMIRRIHVLFFGRGDPKSLGRYTLGSERSVEEWARQAGLKLAI